MNKILISGYYGFNNIGDEAVLGGMLAGLRAELPDIEPVVLSADPAGTERLHGVAAIPRMSLSQVRHALGRTDLFISGGGSLLQDVTSFRSPLYYLGLLWLAQRAGVPAMMFAQGVGPLDHPLNRLLARKLLNQLKAITVRDPGSAGYLEDLGVTIPSIEVTADPSFLLAPDASEQLEAWWAANIPAGRPVIGVALRAWKAVNSDERFTAIADALAALAEQTGALLLFIPMQHEADLPVADAIAGWTPAESRVLRLPLTPREMLAAVGRCDFILAMRLHTLIFAVQQGVPAYGLAYDPKVRDFCLTAGLTMPPRWDEITADTLTPALQEQWESREATRETLRGSAAKLVELATRNITCVKALLNRQE
ncbi:MAG: polysaccharide pyruvyl transferase CsaB [Armatimonadota bacterium]